MTDDTESLPAYLLARYEEEEFNWRVVAARQVTQLLHGEPLAPKMLADIATKRAIVAWCGSRDRVYVGTHSASDPTDPQNYVQGDFVNPTDSVVLRLLVQAYSSRPDFNHEWRM